MARRYKITWDDGRTDRRLYDSHDEACAAVRARYPDADIGHSGDLTDGGRRTLCWPDAESAIDDRQVSTMRFAGQDLTRPWYFQLSERDLIREWEAEGRRFGKSGGVLDLSSDFERELAEFMAPADECCDAHYAARAAVLAAGVKDWDDVDDATSDEAWSGYLCNHPAEHATVDDLRDAYLDGWEAGMAAARKTLELAKLAFERGWRDTGPATLKELADPVYAAAYALGAEYRAGRVMEPHCLLGCGCPRCRLEKIVRAAIGGAS